MQRKNEKTNRKELREFALITGALIPSFFGLLHPWIFERTFPIWPWLTGAILVIWGITLPMTLKPIYLAWMFMGQCLGWINSRIILSIMFFTIILPTGFCMRMLGKDPMSRSINKKTKSYRIQSLSTDKKHMERPY